MFKITPAMQKLHHGLFWLCSRSAVPAAGLRMPGLALHPASLAAAGEAWTSVTLGAKNCLAREKALQDMQRMLSRPFIYFKLWITHCRARKPCPWRGGAHTGLRAGAAQRVGNSLQGASSGRAGAPGPLCCSGSSGSMQDSSPPSPANGSFLSCSKAEGGSGSPTASLPLRPCGRPYGPTRLPPSWQSSRVFWKVLERRR